MKYLINFTSIFVCLSFLLAVICGDTSKNYFKVDIVEAVNLHCKLNNEFYCNPYAIVEFKYSSDKYTTARMECTKSPFWESSFDFQPELCKDVVYINLFQYITPMNRRFLGDGPDENGFERGEINPGYLGRVTLELEKLPFDTIDDWFMVEAPEDNSMIKFPSCIHLRISWTSNTCSEPSQSLVYQINSLNKDHSLSKFEPSNYIPMCKPDFANVYKTRFSTLGGDMGKRNQNEEEKGNPRSNCIEDPNVDYGFRHPSNLTSIEEALVYRIIKRTTGESINFTEFTRDYAKEERNSILSFNDFFKKECLARPELTIERINYILLNHAQNFPINTTNPYLTIDENTLDYPSKLNKKFIENIYNNTLTQFYSLEDIKNLETMDDDSYLRTLNKMTDVIKQINVDNKTELTLLTNDNKVLLTNEGRVDPKEEKFFRLYALYKWNGGHISYDDMKREYMLRRKYFYCYEIVKLMPTNIIFQFIDDKCPDNFVCVDPNGVVISSLGKDPRSVFKSDIEKNGLNLFVNFHNNKAIDDGKVSNRRRSNDIFRTNLRFKSIEKKMKEVSENAQSSLEDDKSNLVNDTSIQTFDDLLKQENGVKVSSGQVPDIISKGDDSEEVYLNKFDRLYIQRKNRILQKMEIIINLVSTNTPLIGESLALVNAKLDKEDLLNDLFLKRERNLLKKYLLIYNSQVPYVQKSARVLFNILTCNTDKNKLRYLLKEMLEGLCYGDSRSIKIFEEIIRTVIIDSLIQTQYFAFEDLHAKVNIVKTLNKPFCYKTITKIRFVEAMLMLDAVKEKITYIIWNNDSNKKIALKIHETELSIPQVLPNNQRLFNYSPNLNYDNAMDVNKNYLNELERIEKFNQNGRLKPNEIAKNIREMSNKFSFKELYQQNYLDSSDEDDREEESGILEKIDSLRKKLDHDLGNHVDKMKRIPTSNTTGGIPPKVKEDDLMNEFQLFYTGVNHALTTKEIDFKKEKQTQIRNSTESKSKKNHLKTPPLQPKFKSIDNPPIGDFAKMSLNQYNNPHIYEAEDQPGPIRLEAKSAPSPKEILQELMKDPNTAKLIHDIEDNPRGKIIFPQEIHSTYEVNRKGTKEITINEDNPTKKLILTNLLDEKSFNDMMDQDEKKDSGDQTGLFNVLKNIQNKKCSFDFLCIETGAIYGPFDNLKPKRVTIMTNQKENMQVIIKPVLIVNSTVEKIVVPANITRPIVVNDDDCDELKMSSNFNSNIYNQNMRFKQLVEKDAKLASVKRKFYRKVQFENEVLSQEIFKQGLNVIIVKRERGYQKLFERTFNTNTDPTEADAMAITLRDAGYDKIIIITGIGRWMGAVTPRLVKEIKQIGGPDITRLISGDFSDNSALDHSFVLVGRRGLCRYNGVFRVKNYDIAKDLRRYFPDFSSDPNDCLFENLTLENEKNKHTENQFFHTVDLRLTLNIVNDNRFSFLTPIVTSVTPNSGPLTGDTCIQIKGYNFGGSTFEIKEVFVRGVVCKDVELINPRLITCKTGSSTIMGPGVGNAVVKLLSGLASPDYTCNMFQYTSAIESNPLSIHVTHIPLPVPVAIPHPQFIHIQPVIPPPLPISLFSFKEKTDSGASSRYDSQGNPDIRDMLKNLKRKMDLPPPVNQDVDKIDNLVTENFKHLLSETNSNGFAEAKDGFRKKRFENIVQRLK